MHTGESVGNYRERVQAVTHRRECRQLQRESTVTHRRDYRESHRRECRQLQRESTGSYTQEIVQAITEGECRQSHTGESVGRL